MITNSVDFAKELLIAAAFKALEWEAACAAVEEACNAVTFPGAVVAQGSAETVKQYIDYKLGLLSEPFPIWITNAGL